jgi:hypothetical protein
MAINFTCSCGKILQVADHYAGKKGRCPACRSVVDIPGQQATGDQAIMAEVIEEPEAYAAAVTTVEDEAPVDSDAGRRREAVAAGAQRLEGLPHHAGEPLPPDVEFFAPPPPEIGALISANSTLRRGKEPWSLAARLAWFFGVAGVGLAVVLVFIVAKLPVAAVALTSFVALVGALVSLWVTRFAHFCSFVGQEGLARYRCRGERDNVHGDMFLFRDAHELRTAQTRHYYNGGYTGTTYDFSWTDVHGRRVYTLTGRYNSEQGTPKATSAFHLATAAELAWSNYLLHNVRDQLAAGESITFGLKGDDYLRIGPGLVVLHSRKNKVRFEGDDIERIRIDQGVVAIMEPGAREGWFTSEGVYKFAYGDLANAQFFLFLMERLVGVRATNK